MNKLQPLEEVTRNLRLIANDEPESIGNESLHEETTNKSVNFGLENNWRHKHLAYKRNFGNLCRVWNNPHDNINADNSRLAQIQPVVLSVKRSNGNVNSSGESSNEPLPARNISRHHTQPDYHKRQEQRKIWKENQALIKRLQSTKTTFNTKEWEKDDKRSQEFLKNQERRRQVLQHELRRAQKSPEALLRSEPLKSYCSNHIKTCCVTSAIDGFGEPSIQDLGHRNLNRKVRIKKRDIINKKLQHESTEKSWRVHDQKSMLLRTGNDEELHSAKAIIADGEASAVHTAFVPQTENEKMRFALLCEESRSLSTNSSEQSDMLGFETSNRNVMGLYGAFSPGAELEAVLNAVEVSDKDLHSGPPSTAIAAEMGNMCGLNQCESCITDFLSCDLALSGGAETDKVSAPESLEQTQTLPDNQEKEASYNGNYFDNDRIPSARAPERKQNKHEINGAPRPDNEADVKNEDEAHKKYKYRDEKSVEYQEESMDDEEYSHDGFEWEI
ncbi:hypothetical protein Plhal304r1_c044g0124841 [Plasmopara halstedii]